MIFLNVEAVSAILKEGMLVSTRLGSNLSWSGNIVYKSKGRILYVALTDRYLNEDLAAGKTMSVKYVNEYFIYLFEGTVANIVAEYPGYVVLHMTSAEEIINSRLSPRFDVYLDASLMSVWDSDMYPAIVTDISYSGTAFVCSKTFDYNEELEIYIHLHKSQSIKARGKIIRKSRKSKPTEYSMQFSEVDEVSNTLLSQYFTQLNDESGRIYKQYITEIRQLQDHFKS